MVPSIPTPLCTTTSNTAEPMPVNQIASGELMGTITNPDHLPHIPALSTCILSQLTLRVGKEGCVLGIKPKWPSGHSQLTDKLVTVRHCYENSEVN